MLRITDTSAAFVLRYPSPGGKRREWAWAHAFATMALSRANARVSIDS